MKVCICGNSSFKCSKSHSTRWGKIQLVRCRKCGLARDIIDYDHAYYYTDEAEIYKPPDNQNFFKRINELSKHYITDIKPLVNPGDRSLEIGCDDGAFLKVMESHGLQALGIELNPRVAKYAVSKGLKVINEPLNEKHFSNKYFNLIVMIHTLEHIQNAEQTLKIIFQVLKPGGYLFVVVPNYGSHVNRAIRRGAWYGFIPGQHIWHFTKKTLKSTIELCGFKEVDNRTIISMMPASKIPFGNFIKKILIQYMKFSDSGNEIQGIFQRPQ